VKSRGPSPLGPAVRRHTLQTNEKREDVLTAHFRALFNLAWFHFNAARKLPPNTAVWAGSRGQGFAREYCAAAYTVNYQLSNLEAALYQAVTEYVKTEMGKAD
jgi:hypothetical protein